MNRGVVYLLLGDSHSVVTAVSVMSLRQWWTGDIALFCGDEVSMKRGRLIAEAAGAKVISFEPKKQRRHVGYASKPMIPGLSPFDETIQIDGDTVVCGWLDGLWPQRDGETVLTPMADWVSTGRKMVGRIKIWEDVAPEEVKQSLSYPYPALNTGILSYCKGNALTDSRWHDMVMRKPQQFISDEIAMQLLLPYHTDSVRMESCRFNCSPLYGIREDVRIWHCHGRKHLRERALPIWWPLYREALEQNYAGIRDWTPAGDRRLKEYLGTQKIE